MSTPTDRAFQATFQLNLAIGPANRPKVIVVSHERSGTHFLMNSLAENLGYVSFPWINLDLELGVNFFAPDSFVDILKLVEGHNIRNLIKSHHEFEFVRSVLDYLLEHFRVIYIYRDVYSVMLSFQSFLWRLKWNEGPKREDLFDFITSHPAGALTRYQYQHANNMIERWKNHVVGWLDAVDANSGKGILAIDFNELDKDFGGTIENISSFLGIPLESSLSRPSRLENVILPNLETSNSKSAVWFDSRSIDFIETVAGDTMDRLYSSRRHQNMTLLGRQ